MEITDEEHARFEEIESALRGTLAGSISLASAKKALDEPNAPKLCLVGIGGDRGPNGMNVKPDVLPFDRKHEAIVREFLGAQLAWMLTVHFDEDTNSEHHRALVRAAGALREAGVFEHKWHERTQWDLAFTEEVDGGYLWTKAERAIGS